MFKRLVLPLILASLLTPLALAQDQSQPAAAPAPTPEQQEMQQQMQQFRAQIMQNMQDKGIDPQEFFGEIRQRMQDGNFDPSDIQQLMIDRGIISKPMIDQMQGTFQKYALSNIRRQLNVPDDEWQVLAPKVQRVLVDTAIINQTNQSFGAAGFLGGLMTNDVANAFHQLRSALRDPSASPDQIASLLKTWREAREKAKAELLAAQSDLVSVLTLRQEAMLMTLGVL